MDVSFGGPGEHGLRPRSVMPGRHPDGGAPTFEEDDLVVTGALVHGIHAVQVQRQAPPEAVHLCRLQGHQVPVPGQPPEVLAWGDTGGGAAGGRPGAQSGVCSSARRPLDPEGVTFEEEGLASDLGHGVKVGAASVEHILPGPGGRERAGLGGSPTPSCPGELGWARPRGQASPKDPARPHHRLQAQRPQQFSQERKAGETEPHARRAGWKVDP